MDKMRDEFEEWMKQRWVKPNLSKYKSGYDNATVNEQWQAWQASRKALVVELPTAWNASYTDKAIVMDASSVVEALEDAGVAYK